MNDLFKSRDVLKVGNKEYVIFRLDALEKAGLTKLGKLPYCDKNMSQGYEECIRKGEIAFTNEILKLGYELRTMESDYPLYWFAYDYMRGIRVDAKPALRPLIGWWISRFIRMHWKKSAVYRRTLGKRRGE